MDNLSSSILALTVSGNSDPNLDNRSDSNLMDSNLPNNQQDDNQQNDNKSDSNLPNNQQDDNQQNDNQSDINLPNNQMNSNQTNSENQPSSSLSSCSILDNLPILVYDCLFQYLDLDEVFKLKLVSKAFYSVVKDYQVTELSFLDYRNCNKYIFSKFEYKSNWFSTRKSNKLRNQLYSTKLALLEGPIVDNFKNLKFLRIKEFDFLPIKLEDLNKFTRLEILELGIEELKLITKHHLQLLNLKALSIGRIHPFDIKKGYGLYIEAPHLSSLQVINYKKDWDSWKVTIDEMVNIKHPESIRYLKSTLYDTIISKFNNLECLELETTRLEKDDLLQLKNLKKLKIIKCNVGKAAIDGLKNLFVKEKPVPEITFNGVKVNDIVKFNEPAYRNAIFEFQMNNYDKLEDDLNFVQTLDHVDMKFLFNNVEQPDLFSKFINIKRIVILEIEDENRLMQFMKNCPNLCEFEVMNHNSLCKLSQQFFNQLPSINSLCHLRFLHGPEFDLDLKFIMKLPHLVHLELPNCSLQIDHEFFNFNELKNLKRIGLGFYDKEVVIEKIGRDSYLLLWGDKLERLVGLRSYSNEKKEKSFISENSVSYCKLVDDLNDLAGSLKFNLLLRHYYYYYYDSY